MIRFAEDDRYKSDRFVVWDDAVMLGEIVRVEKVEILRRGIDVSVRVVPSNLWTVIFFDQREAMFVRSLDTAKEAFGC